MISYTNGNYKVLLFDNGTKIRYNDLDNFTPAFAESMDICISNKCDGLCQFCYANCTIDGEHADLSQPFFESLHPGTEIAINGNDLSHPQLYKFLTHMKEKNIIVNMTVNQRHFIKYFNFIRDLINLKYIHGLGVSLADSNDINLYNDLAQIPNAVLHVIDGLLTEHDIQNLSDKNIKMLILGYKIIGRGRPFYDLHKNEIESNINYLANNIIGLRDHFQVISFDNLAIEHLDLKNKMDPDMWKTFYMGDEGAFTFFIDAVNKKFAISSLEETQHDYNDMSVDEMFNYIRRLNGQK